MDTFRYFLKAKLAACLLLLVVSSASTFAQSAQPVAPVREVTDNSLTLEEISKAVEI